MHLRGTRKHLPARIPQGRQGGVDWDGHQAMYKVGSRYRIILHGDNSWYYKIKFFLIYIEGLSIFEHEGHKV